MNVIEALNLAWSKVSRNQAICGPIPIAEFNAVEPALRRIIRANDWRIICRGPRPQKTSVA